MRSIGITLTEMMDDGYVFPITDISAKYVSPGKFDDELIIETTATALTKVKMCFKYRILRKETGELLVTGKSQNVYTNRETGHITRLPEKYLTRLQAAMEQEKAAAEAQNKEK